MTTEIAVLNLMPKKVETEQQLKKKLGGFSKKVNYTFLRTATYTPKNTDINYLNHYYYDFDDIKKKSFNGFICTGAPLEKMPFESVIYWKELTKIFDWVNKNVFSSYFICWGAQAALYHYYGIEKYLMGKKLSGIFEQKIITQNEKLTKLLPSMIFVPVSRYATNKSADINKVRELSIIVGSKVSGPCLVANKIKNRYYNFNHFEYDFDTLKNEYERDLKVNKKTPVPYNYFPDDDPEKKPADCWSQNSHIFFNNWLSLISEKQGDQQ
tara:strand:- start:3780 stop:4583 length:804 start_codon:yes stop_codon:yes gene_type:complete